MDKNTTVHKCKWNKYEENWDFIEKEEREQNEELVGANVGWPWILDCDFGNKHYR